MGPAVEETLRRAMSAIQSQRPDEALRLTQDILNKNPSQPNALHLYGYALLMQERADEAVAPLEKAFRSLRDPAIETQLAIALRKAGRTDDALGRLARAIKRKPPFPAAIHEYAYLLHSLDRSDEAIDVLRAGMLLMGKSVQSEPPHDRRQHCALPDQGDDDHTECDK